ncbi:unnamed protein product [Echinostoma caproni]|uniref:Glyco_trans_2-like domain-containing protein n=1 Tax=Echinostoma caproni TaxID=27848 RepID=A0A183BB38_9TREM|nr:unnamed protein product [Echinostoma caproni]
MALELWLLSIVSVVTTFVIITFVLLIFIYLSTDPYPNTQREPIEECYLDPHTSEYIKLPFGLTERPEKQLSVIIPAFNETERLPKMLNEALDYLEQRKKVNTKFTYEVIVVDDGSVDHTSEGMLSARGRSLLFADADGATKFADLEKLEDALSATIAEHWVRIYLVACFSHVFSQFICTNVAKHLILAPIFSLRNFRPAVTWSESVMVVTDTTRLHLNVV